MGKMIFKKTVSFAFALVLILGISALPTLAAGSISLDKANYAPDEKITLTATPSQPPSGNTNHTGYWWRAGLPGFGFIQLYLDSSGEFTQEIRFTSARGATHWEQVYKGSYSISGDTMTFTYTLAEHKDAGKEWGTIALPDHKTLTFTYVKGDAVYGDYIDFTHGGLPPFDEPVTRLGEQGGNEDLFVTRFRPASTNSSALNR